MTHILIDLDGVGADWTDGIRQRLEPDLRQFVDDTAWNLTGPGAPEGFLDLVRAAQGTPGFYRTLRPIEGFSLAVRQMAVGGHDVRFCSTPDSMNSTCADDKIAWLEDVVGTGWSKRLILTHDKTLIRGGILIDDKPEITGAMIPTWEHVVFDQPYNQNPIDRRRRIEHWREWPLLDLSSPKFALGGYVPRNYDLGRYEDLKVPA